MLFYSTCFLTTIIRCLKITSFSVQERVLGLFVILQEGLLTPVIFYFLNSFLNKSCHSAHDAQVGYEDVRVRIASCGQRPL